jgi:hypothetical protein
MQSNQRDEGALRVSARSATRCAASALLARLFGAVILAVTVNVIAGVIQ